VRGTSTLATGEGGDKAAARSLLRGLAGALLLVAAFFTPEAGRAQTIPPDAPWRTLETAHFRVTFPEHLEWVGREAAARAERAYDRLSELFVEAPEGRTEVLITDHVDRSNGSARVAPFKQVVIFARPPVDGLALSHFDDWLELVLVHELTHVFHFDVAGPVGDALRAVFGRVPVTWPFFPQQSTPRWTVEGLATWYESGLSESGRVRGSQHEMVLRTAALEDRFEEIDEASGLSPVWPSGQRPYIYGSLFFDYLIDRFGIDRMRDFVEAVGGQLVPYRLDAAAEAAFGVSFSEAWREWRAARTDEAEAMRERLAAKAPLTELEVITGGARFALYPQVTADGRSLLYSRSDGRSDAQLRRSALDGTESEHFTRVNGAAAFDVRADGQVVFAQLERVDPYRTYSDLWIADPDGDTRRLTEGARLDHPTVSPDGREIVAIQVENASTRLVAVDGRSGAVTGDVTPAEPDVHWAFPAISPDGRWIAAARWTKGAFFDVVVLERGKGDAWSGPPPERRTIRVTNDRAVDTAPTWSPDGRWLLWASDRSGIPNILAAPFDPESGEVGAARQVTNVVTGVHFPSVSPDGRWLYLSSYHAEGWEIERTRFDPSTFVEPFPLDERFRPGDGPIPWVASIEPASDADVDDYSPFPTLWPRFWQPAILPSVTSRGVDVIGPSYGFRTAAGDLVGRHAVDLDLLISTSDARLSGNVGYRWAGLGNPTVSLGASQFWDAAGPFRQEVEGEPRTFFIDERERSASAAATFRRARIRSDVALSVSGGLVWERRSVLEPDGSRSPDLALEDPDSRFAELRSTVSFSTARSHAFSVGFEEGIAGFVSARTRDELDLAEDEDGALGFDRSVDDLIGQLRVYRGFRGPGFGDHVVALRASGGVARGPGADAFHFDVGGASGEREPVTGFGLFGGRNYFFPVRGFENGRQGGRYAWAATAEYRVPIALVNEGLGLFPLHVDRLSGTAWVDAGNAWGPEDPGGAAFDNPREDPLVAAGVEFLADLTTLFSVEVTLRTGVAFPITPSENPSLYVRFGRPF